MKEKNEAQTLLEELKNSKQEMQNEVRGIFPGHLNDAALEQCGEKDFWFNPCSIMRVYFVKLGLAEKAEG